MIPFNALVGISSVVLICEFEKVEGLLVDTMECLVNKLSVKCWEPSLLVHYLAFGVSNNLSSIIKVEVMLLNNVKDVVDLVDDQTV